MARLRVRSPGVTVEAKQAQIDPTAYPLPNTLTPIPDLSPYTVSVDEKQPYVEPVESPTANSLTNLIMRAFQAPAEAPAAPEQPYQMPPPPEPVSKAPAGSAFINQLRPPLQPVRSFTEPPERDQAESAPPLLGQEPPAPQAQPLPSRQILHAIGIPAQLHRAMAPQVERTFPKAVVPEQPKPSPTQPTPPPKTFRASPTTVQDNFKFSPLWQSPAPTGRKVVVSLPDKKVVVYNPDGSILREYPAYIGKASAPTPRGQFRVMENIKPNSAEWYYGGHWLGFASGYGRGEKPGKGGSYAGIHGWVYSREDEAGEKEEPGWKTSTHGCVQLSNKDVADLAALVGAGDPVTILDTPFAPPPPRPPTVPVRPVGYGGVLQMLMPH